MQYEYMKFLTDNERADLTARHRIERDKRVCDRIKAILLFDKRWTYDQIAEALLLTSTTIRNHISDYTLSKKIRPESGGSSERLSKEQSDELLKILDEHIYLYVKDIAALIKAKWGIEYSIAGLRNWLYRNGFTYKKPAIVPGKANIEQQKEWIIEYNSLKENLKEDETIGFIDGVHPTHNVELAYGWIRKGIRKEIPSNTGRARLNLSGMIDVISNNILIQEDTTLNAQSIIQFFERIEAVYPDKSKIHIFCDNARYYRNKLVFSYLNGSRIELHFLPPYSPNLNPIERLWKWMKETVMYNSYYELFEDFKIAIFGFFEMLSRASPSSELGQSFMRKIRDNFRAIGFS